MVPYYIGAIIYVKAVILPGQFPSVHYWDSNWPMLVLLFGSGDIMGQGSADPRW